MASIRVAPRLMNHFKLSIEKNLEPQVNPLSSYTLAKRRATTNQEILRTKHNLSFLKIYLNRLIMVNIKQAS